MTACSFVKVSTPPEGVLSNVPPSALLIRMAGTGGGSPVLHADPRLNITSVVLKGLNEKYAAERKAAPKTSSKK